MYFSIKEKLILNDTSRYNGLIFVEAGFRSLFPNISLYLYVNFYKKLLKVRFDNFAFGYV